MLACLRVVCLRSCCGRCSGFVGAQSCQPPHGRLVRRWFLGAAAGACAVGCCLCSGPACFGVGWSCPDRLRLGLCFLLDRGWCCAGAWPPSWWGLLHWCVAPPHGRACCFAVWPPSWWGVLCRCVAPLMVGRAVLVPVRRGGCAWCGGAWLELSLCVPPGGRRWVRVGGACGGVLAGAMRGLFCLFGVVFAALRWRVRVGVVGGWVAVVVVLIAWPGWVLCWSAAPLMVGRTVLVRAPPRGGACCFSFVPPPMVGRAALVCGPPLAGRDVLVCAPPLGGACCVGVYPPPPWRGVLRWFLVHSWWSLLCWCVAPLSA